MLTPGLGGLQLDAKIRELTPPEWLKLDSLSTTRRQARNQKVTSCNDLFIFSKTASLQPTLRLFT
jgi:hypothetical protein